MSRQFAAREPLYARFGDAFVILSVTLLSLALGVWFIARLGLELSSAMLAALGAYSILLLLHLLVRRTLMPAGDDQLPDDDPHWQARAAQRFEAELAQRLAEAENAPDGPGQPVPPAEPGEWPEPLPMPGHLHAEPRPDRTQAPADAFKFRPSRSPYFDSDDPGETPAAADQDAPPAEAGQPAAGPPSDMNVELIQSLIKKLADELNAPPADDGDGQQPRSEQPASSPDLMVGRSAAALDTAARAMRRQAPDAAAQAPARPLAAPAGEIPSWWPAARNAARAPEQGAPPALDPQLARIAEAIAAERIEVLLEPIHALAEGRARHYEITMRLLTADGAPIEQRDYARAALGSGLMPRIDAARMLRAARVARRLSQRGQQGSVLTAMAGESLIGEEFLNAAAAQPGADGRMGLVLSFTQADVRTFTPVHAEALGSMAAGGFAFALEDVTDLDMDFGSLKAMGFEFIKLDAQVFLDGLRAPSGRVPAADICRFLSEFGLTLIVGRIEDDWLLARILGFGVLLGKGALFGGPKLVKAEVVAEPGSAAA
jgi:cyclic-di-GMP phosphodiesterase TipF (flagellum assembly factor)